jgi:hypothetical protein
MALLRTWSGKQALAGLVACFIALQALVAGLHAASIVNLQFLANDLASICHGGTADTGAPAQPRSDHTSACCILGCNTASQTAKPADAWSYAPPRLEATRVELAIRSFAQLPSHLIDRAHRPRSPPTA